MGPGLHGASCTVLKYLSVVFYLIPRESNTICQRLGMFPIHELVGRERGKGVQVSPSKFPCASTLPLFRIFAYLSLLPPRLHMDPRYLCLSKTVQVVPPPKSKKNQTPKHPPPKPSWSKSKAHPLLRWRGSCFITMALTIKSREWEGI